MGSRGRCPTSRATPPAVSFVMSSGSSRLGSTRSASSVRNTESAPVATPMPTRVPVAGSSSGGMRRSRSATSARLRGLPEGQDSSESNHFGSLSRRAPSCVLDVASDPTSPTSRSAEPLTRRSSGSPLATTAGALRGPSNHRDCGVSGDRLLESVDVVHRHDGLHGVLARDELAEVMRRTGCASSDRRR